MYGVYSPRKLVGYKRGIRSATLCRKTVYRLQKGLSRAYTFKSAPPKWRVAFFGSGDVALETAKLLHESKDIVSNLQVICPPDKPLPKSSLTEGIDAYGVHVRRWAKQVGVISHTYNKENLDEVIAVCNSADIGIVVDFGYLIPTKIIDAFAYWPILMHPSLLPKYRGATPIERTLMSGDTECGISVLQLHPNKFDAGKLILQRSFPIKDDTVTIKELRPFLARKGAEAVVECLRNYDEVIKQIKDQPNEGVSPAPKLKQMDYIIDWSRGTHTSIYNQWRALSSLRTSLVGQRADTFSSSLDVTIHEIKPPSQVGHKCPITNDKTETGSIVFDKHNDLLWARCADGNWLAISQLQWASKKAMRRVTDFVNGIQLKRNPHLRFDSTDMLARLVGSSVK